MARPVGQIPLEVYETIDAAVQTDEALVPLWHVLEHEEPNPSPDLLEALQARRYRAAAQARALGRLYAAYSEQMNLAEDPFTYQYDPDLEAWREGAERWAEATATDAPPPRSATPRGSAGRVPRLWVRDPANSSAASPSGI